jgi:succinate dehydrogenase / fumarate reductase, cytochrome b subunit
VTRRSAFRPSTIALQAVAAVSGVFLFGWVLLHLAGNLTLFGGAAAADGYAAMLRRTGPLLWLVRLALLLAFALHLWATATLARRAPPGSRLVAAGRTRSATVASRSMRAGGLLLLLFLVYHLLHLTIGTAHPQFLAGRVHHNVVTGLGVPLVAAVYLAASALLGLHLSHGLWAALGSLGLRPDRDPRRNRRLATLFGLLVGGAFASIPLAVAAGALP